MEFEIQPFGGNAIQGGNPFGSYLANSPASNLVGLANDVAYVTNAAGNLARRIAPGLKTLGQSFGGTAGKLRGHPSIKKKAPRTIKAASSTTRTSGTGGSMAYGKRTKTKRPARRRS